MSSKLRMTGLISGMDTESIISALVENKQTKVDKTKKEQTKMEWKIDAWKDVNKELQTLQGTVSNMRFTSAYMKKTTKASNSNKVSVLTGDSAVNSVQSLKVSKLAKTAYLTGGAVETTSGSKASALTKLSDLGFSGSGTIKIASSGEEVSLDVNENTTINDFLTKAQNAGLNANFDAATQRLFISSKNSGKGNDFTITSTSADGNDALAKLGLQSKEYYTGLTSINQSEVDSSVATRLASNLSSYNDLKAQEAKLAAQISATQTKIDNGDLNADPSSYDSAISSAKDDLDEAKKALSDIRRSDYETDEAYETAKQALQDKVDEKQLDYDAIKAKQDEVSAYATNPDKLTELRDKITELEKNFTNIQSSTSTDDDGNTITTYTADASEKLKTDVKAIYQARVDAAAGMGTESSKYATKIAGEDAEITLNGAKFTSTSNVFNINGLTITTMGTTADDEEITLTTETDTSGIYDMIKKFVSTYNTVINKLSSLYNAESAKGYEPLTDEEKEAMSESEAEKYEKKIKDALLRRDGDLNSIMNSITTEMTNPIKIGNKTISLSTFGINGLSYFSAKDNEKYALHIDGDADDSDTSGNTDKLKNMITNDPDTVIAFFTKLTQNIYGEMSNMSKSVNGYRTFGSFYNDKKMDEDYKSYKTKISDLEEKVSDYEDKLYKQYTAMEKAMAKLQSSTSGLTSLMGSSS